MVDKLSGNDSNLMNLVHIIFIFHRFDKCEDTCATATHIPLSWSKLGSQQI